MTDAAQADQCQYKSRKSRRERNKRWRLFAKQNGRCHWCGGLMQMNALQLSLLTGGWKHNNSYATFEHLIPKSKGGKNKDILAHASCNRDRPKRRFAHDPVYGAAAKATAPLDNIKN